MIRKIISRGLQVVGALALLAVVGLFLGETIRAKAGSPTMALAGNMRAENLSAFGERQMEADAPPPPAVMAPAAPKPSVHALKKAAPKGGPSDGVIGLGGLGSRGSGATGGGRGDSAAKDKSDEGGIEGEGKAPGVPPAATREWFPESFLFEPLIVTGPSGVATVPAKVPDRLTTWRVLALAHSRAGQQAGTVSSFIGTLPAYVEPVVPAFLVAGDAVRLPVQLVNTTPDPLRQLFHVEATGAELGAAGGSVEVPASGSKVEYVGMRTPRPGDVMFKAILGNTDAVVRTFQVRPNGKPVDQSFGGTLAAPRKLELAAPDKADPESAHVRLLVYPGALALLRTELGAASSRDGADADAYALLLAGKAPELLTTLGEKPDKDVLRQLTLVATQRALRWGRGADLPTAILFSEAALAHPDNAVLQRLGQRLVAQVAQSQRPDGTFSGADGWTLQRLLVTTAQAVQAIGADHSDERAQQRLAAARLRAEGAFERNLKLVDDGYTAAAILASGAVTGSMADTLRERVRKAVKALPDGARVLDPEQGIVRADGQAPSEAEATALAALALDGDKLATWRPDLGSALLGRYNGDAGWGDGQTNLACLRAVMSLFRDPLPKKVFVSLEMDGRAITNGSFEGERLKDTLGLEAAVKGAAGKHTWTVKAEPPLPGLGYAFTLRTWVPWEKQEGQGGFELQLKVAEKLKVGAPANVDIQAVAPSGLPAQIRQALPAGVQADRASLEKLRTEGAISSFEISEGAVTLQVPARAANEAFTARYRVIPTLAGTLHAAASTISPPGQPGLAYELPPTVWTVQ